MDLVNYPHELLEIVDENDEVIGAASRSIVHRAPGLLHREIDILVHDDQGRVLFQQRSRNKHHKPLEWTSAAGGHVPAGVTPLEAAKVELREELGLAGELRFLHKSLVVQEKNYCFVYFFEYIYNGEKINFDAKEIEQVKFVPKDEFGPQAFAPNGIYHKAAEAAELYWSGALN